MFWCQSATSDHNIKWRRIKNTTVIMNKMIMTNTSQRFIKIYSHQKVNLVLKKKPVCKVSLEDVFIDYLTHFLLRCISDSLHPVSACLWHPDVPPRDSHGAIHIPGLHHLLEALLSPVWRSVFHRSSMQLHFHPVHSVLTTLPCKINTVKKTKPVMQQTQKLFCVVISLSPQFTH